MVAQKGLLCCWPFILSPEYLTPISRAVSVQVVIRKVAKRGGHVTPRISGRPLAGRVGLGLLPGLTQGLSAPVLFLPKYWPIAQTRAAVKLPSSPAYLPSSSPLLLLNMFLLTSSLGEVQSCRKVVRTIPCFFSQFASVSALSKEGHPSPFSPHTRVSHVLRVSVAQSLVVTQPLNATLNSSSPS